MSAQGVQRSVGRYEIVREIGRGGMAVVYLARQTDLDRDVALKELAAFYSNDPAFAERFIRESRVAGSLAHPNIVTVHDYFEHEGTPYIAMEYLERGSLRPLISRLSLPQVVGVLEGLLSGLTHAEARGVVHRDLKPENVMITSEGGVKVADFGIAKALNSAAPSRFLTATGTTVGTPAYMAPEQAMGRAVGPWTDLYSLGIIAYEMLVGEVPYADTETPVAIMLRQVNEPVPSVREARPELDPRLADVVERLLRKEPADRYQSARDAWEELEEIVVSAVGPLWRREARLTAAAAAAETSDPLTPAPFHEESVVEKQPEAEAFQTFVPKRARGEQPERAPGPQVDGEAELEAERAADVAPALDFAAELGSEAKPPPAVGAGGESQAVSAPDEVDEAVSAAAPDAVDAAAAPAAPGDVREPSEEAAAETDDGRVPADPQPASADRFRTYRPRGIVPPLPREDEEQEQPAEPGPPQPVPPARAEPEPEPARVAAAVPELSVGATVPPTSRRKDTTFTWPVSPGGRLLRLRLVGVAVAVLVAVTAVGLLLLARDPAGPAAAPAPEPQPPPASPPVEEPAEPEPSEPPAADLELPAGQRLTLAVAGDRLYVGDPKGRVVQLDGRTLKPQRLATDPAGLHAVAIAAGSVYAADRNMLIRFRPTDLGPVEAAPLVPALLAGGAGGPLAGAFGADGDRVCLVSGLELGPCAKLGFSPAGLGVASTSLVVAADGGAGSVLPLRVAGDELVPDQPIDVGAKPQGTLVAFRGKLYVPVERGIAVVDLAARRLETTIALPTTPSSLWVVPFNGRLFATLPASNEVAVVDTSAPASEPTLTQVGERPAAVAGARASAGARSVVYVVNAGDGTISRLDALTGERIDSVKVDALAAGAPQRLIARTASFREAGGVVTATIQFESGRLRPDALVVRDADIGDGSARVEIWQAGVATRFGRNSGHGVSMRVVPASARLDVRLAVQAGAFTKLTARVARDGRGVVFALTETPPPPSQPPPSQPPPSQPPPSQPPPSQPPPRPRPPIEVG